MPNTKQPFTREMLIKEMEIRYLQFLHMPYIPPDLQGQYEVLAEFFDEPGDDDDETEIYTDINERNEQ